MTLNIGILGLPNVGKSTLFNALSQAQAGEAGGAGQAATANYPFTTIEPNRAVVPVPDARLERLAALTGVGRAVHATVEFVDIAGLVRGASQGEGLGNQFLGNVRDTDALIHVVRCFGDPNVVHVSPEPDARQDIEIVELELILADLEQLERKLERLTRQAKGDPSYRPLLAMASDSRRHLEAGDPLATFAGRQEPAFASLNKEMRFLTTKPVIYLANVDEEGLAGDDECVNTVRQIAAGREAEVVVMCAALEADLAGLSAAERQEYLALAGVASSGLDQVIRRGYALLGLISFFSMNENEVRAWTIGKGWPAPRAAGVIHTDFERGFIRAEVIPYSVFDRLGSAAAARAAGEMQIEGRDYVVQDGDVMYIRFSV